VSPVKYELCFDIPEDDILHSHRRENLKSYKQPTYFTVFLMIHFAVVMLFNPDGRMLPNFPPLPGSIFGTRSLHNRCFTVKISFEVTCQLLLKY
jgi:hypothetical protein